MHTPCLDRKSRTQAGVMALIASVVAAMLLVVGCGQPVSGAEPQAAGGGGSAQLEP